MNQTTMEGFKFAIQSKSESKNTRSGRDNSFNIGNSEFFQNLNPVTKQYLKQIEKSYVNRTESIASNDKDDVNKSALTEKYK